MHIVGSLLNGPRTKDDYKIEGEKTGWKIKDHPSYKQEDSLRVMGDPIKRLQEIEKNNPPRDPKFPALDSSRRYNIFVQEDRPLLGRVSPPSNKNGFSCYTIDLAKDVYVPDPKYYQQFYKTASKIFGYLAIASSLGFWVLTIPTNANQGILIGKISLFVLTAFFGITWDRFSTFSHRAEMVQLNTVEEVQLRERGETLERLCKRRDEEFARDFFDHAMCTSADGTYSIENNVIRKNERELIKEQKKDKGIESSVRK